jgi:thiamine transport system ATP-binding protein
MLRVTELRVTYGETVAVDDVSLDVADGEVLCLLGPSGCGKSTLLRTVAGLEEPDRGTVAIDGADVTRARPDRRPIGLMFQDGALFPHRDVAGNVGFGPRMRGVPADEVAARVGRALDLVGLPGTEHRDVTSLSGGEQQRVALARAIAPRPRLLMLDEPLGSLDRALRDRLVRDLPEVFERLDATVLYVTHDQDEALGLADRVALMRAGRIVQVGTPDELWRRPRTAWVATFLGVEDVVTAAPDGDRLVTPFGHVDRPADLPGPHAVVALPGALTLATRGAGEGRTLAGEVTERGFAGDHVVLRVALDAGPTVRVPVWRGDAPHPGDRVTVAVDPTALRAVTDDR